MAANLRTQPMNRSPHYCTVGTWSTFPTAGTPGGFSKPEETFKSLVHSSYFCFHWKLQRQDIFIHYFFNILGHFRNTLLNSKSKVRSCGTDNNRSDSNIVFLDYLEHVAYIQWQDSYEKRDGISGWSQAAATASVNGVYALPGELTWCPVILICM